MRDDTPRSFAPVPPQPPDARTRVPSPPLAPAAMQPLLLLRLTVALTLTLLAAACVYLACR